jgi:hypothetical protein
MLTCTSASYWKKSWQRLSGGDCMPDKQASLVDLDAQHRTMLILWFAFLMSVAMYFVIAIVVPRPGEMENRTLALVFSAISAFLVVLSFPIKKKYLARAVETQQVRLVNTALVLAAAFCEGAALIGLLDLFIARDRYYFVLIAISFLGILLHFPQRSHLESASVNPGSQSD